MTTESTDGETIMWAGSVSQWHYASKWCMVLLMLALLAGTFFVQFLITDAMTLWIMRGVFALVALVIVLWIHFDRTARQYTVTNKRVSVEFGLISKQSTELRIHDIRSINLTTTGLSGLAGIGRLEFSSAASDDAEVIFWNTPSAEKIRDMVRALQSSTA